MYLFYRAATSLLSPFASLLLHRRLARGKEEASRMPERLGVASLPRPHGKLVWIHAASVGESNAVLPLIEALLAQHPKLQVLLTTVTVTSAALMGGRLPARAVHQFAPVDTPGAVKAFLRHWRPDVALWVDSELWPNLIMQTRTSGAVMGIVNARMSERSFKRWQMASSFIRELLSGFSICFAQSLEDAKRLRALGSAAVMPVGNLKYDAPALPCDEGELVRLREALGARPSWVAASTHSGEEELIAEVHRKLSGQGVKPLTIIVPRHAVRGDAIMAALGGLNVARRSQGQAVTPQTDIYLADTMGELGLFYRLAPIAFIGKTLLVRGGQNPLEAARTGAAILAGSHMENFAAITADMERDGALTRIKDADDLTATLARLFADDAARADLGHKALEHMRTHGGVLAAITEELRRYLA